jgi:SM-20-related protein
LSPAERIADELALQGWSSAPDFICVELARALRQDAAEAQAAGRFRAARVGGRGRLRIDTRVRRDSTFWLDPAAATPAECACLERLEGLRAALNRELQLGLFHLEAHFACYEAGAFYQKHLDRPQGSDARIVSCVLYLNEGWKSSQGGALRLYLDDPQQAPYRDFLPEAGRLVVFSSERFWHEVLPASRTRWSVTAWFSRR